MDFVINYRKVLWILISIELISPNWASRFYSNEVRALSVLPMDKLIFMKSNFVDDYVNESDINVEENERVDDHLEERMVYTLPKAFPLKKIDNKLIKRGDHWDEKGGDSKVSKIFQFALTTLSFLAFGGYLLALVISSIRRNATIPTPGNVIVFSSLQSLQNFKRPKRHIFFVDPMENNFPIDQCYKGMIMLSQEYASYKNN